MPVLHSPDSSSAVLAVLRAAYRFTEVITAGTKLRLQQLVYSLVIVWLFMRATSVVTSRPPGSFVGCDRHIFRWLLLGVVHHQSLTMLYSVGLLSLAFQAVQQPGQGPRASCTLTSEGRPVNAEIQLWLGPDWTPFSLKAYSEDGKLRPIQTLVGTRNTAAMIEVRNVGEYTSSPLALPPTTQRARWLFSPRFVHRS